MNNTTKIILSDGLEINIDKDKFEKLNTTNKKLEVIINIRKFAEGIGKYNLKIEEIKNTEISETNKKDIIGQINKLKDDVDSLSEKFIAFYGEYQEYQDQDTAESILAIIDKTTKEIQELSDITPIINLSILHGFLGGKTYTISDVKQYKDLIGISDTKIRLIEEWYCVKLYLNTITKSKDKTFTIKETTLIKDKINGFKADLLSTQQILDLLKKLYNSEYIELKIEAKTNKISKFVFTSLGEDFILNSIDNSYMWKSYYVTNEYEYEGKKSSLESIEE